MIRHQRLNTLKYIAQYYVLRVALSQSLVYNTKVIDNHANYKGKGV